jgi:hypothetical protein
MAVLAGVWTAGACKSARADTFDTLPQPVREPALEPEGAPDPAPQPWSPLLPSARPPGHSPHVKLEAGASYRWLGPLHLFGGEVGGSLLLHRPRVAEAPEAFLGIRYALYRSQAGLLAHLVRTGVNVVFPSGALRPSLGADLLWMGVVRATAPGGVVQHWGLGLNAALTVDLATTSEGNALYVGPRLDVDIFPHVLVPRTISLSGSVDVGYRF